MGTEYGCRRCRSCHLSLQLCCLPVLLCAAADQARKDLCLHQPQAVLLPSGHRFRCVCGWCSGFHPEPAQRYRHDHPQQLLLRLRSGCGGCHRYLPENLHGADVRFTGHLAGRHASGQLQLFQRQRCPHEARRQLCPSGCFDGHHLGGCALLPLPEASGYPCL